MVISMATTATTSPQNENRVQNIKKQFEVNKQRPPNLVITKEEPISRTLVNSTLYTEVNKKRGKNSPGIKRSPAFRCDKIVRGGGVKPSSVVNKVKLFEDSVTETNYLEPYDRKVYRSAENITENIRNEQDLCRSHEDVSKPLPPGPPPKKPPRTFAHTPEQIASQSVISNNTNNKNGLIRNNAVKCSDKPVISNSKPLIQNSKPVIQNSKPGLQKGHSYAAILKSPPKIQNGIKPMINSTKPMINGTKPTVNSNKPTVNGNKPAVNSNKPTVKPMVNGSRTIKSAGNSTLNSSKSMMNGSPKRRPREPPPKMPPRSKTESHLQYKPKNKPDLSARALLTSCIPMCNSSAAQYEALPQRLTAREISAPVPIPRSQSEEHIYAEPFNKDPSAGVPVKFQPTPLLLTSTGTNGLYYMSTLIEGHRPPWPGLPQRPTHLPLCSSFSTPSLRTIPHSPPSNYGRPSMSPPSLSPPQKPTAVGRLSPQRPIPAQRTFVDARLTPPPENGTSPPQRVQRPTEAPPQKPQRSGAIARLAAKVTSGGQRSNEEIDENRVSIDFF
ncbi:hypothetical protein B566_EDAN008989 [Ephemera danica]|nr:hypothetical protein B566_EDAN008989 [Ephemera danica]